MNRAVAFVALAVLVVGCLELPGDDRRRRRATVEGTFDAPGPAEQWHQDVAEYDLVSPTMAIQKEPVRTPGGGARYAVTIPEVNATVRARLGPELRTHEFTVHWRLHPHGPSFSMVERDLSGQDVFSVSLPHPGTYRVTAQILPRDGGPFDDSGYAEWKAIVNYRARIESEVFPLRANGTPPPPTYYAMADQFDFSLPRDLGTGEFRTFYRGNYSADRGSDVDLEVVDVDRRSRLCTGTAGLSSTTPTPTKSEEQLLVPYMGAGAWRVQVGALSLECAPDAHYHNAGSVPYILEMRLNGKGFF